MVLECNPLNTDISQERPNCTNSERHWYLWGSDKNAKNKTKIPSNIPLRKY